MKGLLILMSLFFLPHARAQTDVTQIQQEINTSVWKPFQEAFETLDAKALNELYANQVLRVTPNGIDTENSFKAANVKRFNSFLEEGTSIFLDFWFDSRHTNETTSYEVGFYRIRAAKDNSTTNSYGQFHIVLKRIKGQWKITQDWDTTTIKGSPISAEDFAKRQPMAF
ncbi:nuclear transport factor 2 family protein [Flavobacteriaceae bacterium TP-CH-4]|uniref:Nuclear transport factor 2 family protein n=1 Tax=Pelagihabitans pacificus TaxID=2696054 RepID=A0A967AU24_9FLAO|nr:nuclear transport factor 2 family protein [Pelagihabitans pacificus]NHF60396.1 nuclear transport factor 2 family protein [Pelagihabitans pacificus]